MKICDGDHVPVEERVSDLPPGVGVAIEAALRRDPEARPASALELATLAAEYAASKGLSTPVATAIADMLAERTTLDETLTRLMAYPVGTE